MLILPYDVITLIFDHLDFRDQVRCSSVCKTWRLCFQNSFESVVIESPKTDKKDAYSESLLLWLFRVKGDTTRHLKVSFHAPQGAVAVMDLIAAKRWTRLESISLCRHFWLDSKAACQAVNSSRWMTVIENCSSRLRHLNLHYSSLFIKSKDLLTILAMCNRLTHFYYRETRDQFDEIADSKEEPPVHEPASNVLLPRSNLTHLTWWADYDIPFGTVLPLCPKLEALTVRDDGYITSGELGALIDLLLQKRNPKLRFFSIGGDIDTKSNHSLPVSEEDTVGLCSLDITPWKEDEEHHGWLLQVAADLFAAHFATLSSLSLVIDQHDAVPFWRLVCRPKSSVSPLTSLTYCFPPFQTDGVELEGLFCIFLKQCPHITYLNLENVPWNTLQLLRVLSASSSLKDVVISQTSVSIQALDELDEQTSKTLFTLPSLTRLELALPFHDTFLRQLDRLENLTCIVLGEGPVLSYTELVRFFATKTPHLERIEMHRSNCMDVKTTSEIEYALTRTPSRPQVSIK